MPKKPNLKSGTITNVLTKWIKQQPWEEAIEVEKKSKNSTFRTSIKIDDKPHDMFFEADEVNGWLSVYAYGPTKVPPFRMGELTRLLNKINLRLTIGRLACIDDHDANPVQYRARIDLNGGKLTTAQIDTLALTAWKIFTLYGPIIEEVALRKKSASRCWTALIEAETSLPIAQRN